MKALILKDLKIFLSSKVVWITGFILPIFLITLFTFVYGGVNPNKKPTPKTLNVAACDLDNTEISKKTLIQFKTIPNVIFESLDSGEALNLVRSGKRASILMIDNGFADSFLSGNNLPIELQYDEAKSFEIGLLQGALISKLNSLNSQMGQLSAQRLRHKMSKNLSADNKDSKNDFLKSYDKFVEDYARTVSNSNSSNSTTNAFGIEQLQLKPIISSDNNKTTLALVQAVAGTSILMLLFLLSGIGASILDEKQAGTLKRILCAPITPSHILLSKCISVNIISICQLLVMFLYANLVFGLPIFKVFPALIILIVLTSYACTSFGMLLASCAQSRQQIQGLSTFIILVMSCLGGSMMPLFFMPTFMQKIAVVSINYWAIEGFFDIFWRQLPLMSTNFLSKLSVLFIIGSVINFVALKLFQRNLFKD
ncbi:MAG: ABC transporter permease [Alphaproteobacteria bacterium]|nr:ABC transporter permease [Alphaproteobacteria bacterium]